MCFALSTTIRRRNSLLPRNWSEKSKSGVGPDLRPRTSDFTLLTLTLPLPLSNFARPDSRGRLSPHKQLWPLEEVRGPKSEVCVIVTGITERTSRNGNRLQRWQNGGSQYGDHAI
jgi:hypothetical protein